MRGITLNVQAAQAQALAPIKAILLRHPGDHQVTIVAGRHNAERRLTLGGDFDCDASTECCALLSEFGDIVVSEQ